MVEFFSLDCICSLFHLSTLTSPLLPGFEGQIFCLYSLNLLVSGTRLLELIKEQICPGYSLVIGHWSIVIKFDLYEFVIEMIFLLLLRRFQDS